MIAFVDFETLGLHPDRHAIWEAAVKVRSEDGTSGTRTWQLMLTPDELEAADPIALEMTRFHERWHKPASSLTLVSKREFAHQFADFVGDSQWFGMVPSFDEERARRLLEKHGVQHRWHYHLIDVEALCLGYLAREGQFLTHPYKSDTISTAMDVDPKQFDRHTAMGDVLWTEALYDAVMRPVEA